MITERDRNDLKSIPEIIELAVQHLLIDERATADDDIVIDADDDVDANGTQANGFSDVVANLVADENATPDLVQQVKPEYKEFLRLLSTMRFRAGRLVSGPDGPKPNFNYYDDFWKTHKAKFPILWRLARVVLSTPASSIAVESLFSITKSIDSDRRGNLLTSRLGMMTLSNSWRRMAGGLYTDTSHHIPPHPMFDVDLDRSIRYLQQPSAEQLKGLDDMTDAFTKVDDDMATASVTFQDLLAAELDIVTKNAADDGDEWNEEGNTRPMESDSEREAGDADDYDDDSEVDEEDLESTDDDAPARKRRRRN